MKRASFAVSAVLAATALGLPAATAATVPPPWTNCTTYNHKWPHGVGRDHAVDHTSGTPVRNFLHSTKIYNIAMNHNSDLDRDKDGIACEKL